MTSTIICIALIGIFLTLLVILAHSFHALDEKIKIAKIEMYNNINFDAKESLLDKIVLDTFNNFKVNNPDLSDTDSYINQEKILDIIKIVTAKAFIKITPAIKTNIALVYNIDKEDQLIDVIGEKVSLLVMNFASEVNSTIVD